MNNSKSYSQIGYLPKGESINQTWNESKLDCFVSDTNLALSKSEAEKNSYKGEIRKVRVTLTLSVEDI